jgi:O-antigen/teichoic acid export membrane protein
MPSTGVGQKLASGTAWVAIGEALAGAATLGATIVAARILDPRDFGVMGVVTLAIAILESFTTSGFEQALVHRDKNVESLLNVAWTWHVLRGLAMAALLCAVSPLIARVYDESRLMPLLIACSLYVVLHGFHNVGTIFFQRKLDFRTQFFIKLARALFSTLVFIPAVLVLKSVWALAIGYVGGAFFQVAISYVAHPYRPRFEWSRDKLSQLMTFGKWITGLTLMGFVIVQGDDVFISKYLGLAALGFYQKAYEISNLPATQITHVVSRVSFPTYARLRSEPDELRAAFEKVMRTTILVTAPVSVVIYSFIPEFVHYVIGDDWLPIVPLVRILVIAGFVRSFQAIAGALFQATGRPDLDFKMNFPRFLFTVLLIWPACAYFGLAGACWVVLAAISVTLPIWFYGVHSLIKLSPLRVLRLNAVAIAGSTAIFALISYLRP